MFDATLHIPPFNVRLRSPFAAVRRHVQAFYPRAVLPADGGAFIDFDIEVVPARVLRCRSSASAVSRPSR